MGNTATDRRSFLKTGAIVAAPLAAAAPVAALAGDDSAARLARLEDERAFPAWAYRIVSRRCARLVRGLQRDRALSRDLAAQPAPDPEPDYDGPEHAALARAIRGLPPGQRAAIALHHFEDMSIAETAVALDVPAGTVKTRLMHARRALRAALEGA